MPRIFVLIYLCIGLLLDGQAQQLVWNQAAPTLGDRWEGISVATDDKMYVFTGLFLNPGFTMQTISEVYDPVENTWTEIAIMPVLANHQGHLLNGKEIWLFGGFDGMGQTLDLVQIYNTQTDSWSQGPPLPGPRAGGAAVILDNKIYFFGGVLADRNTGSDDHWVLDLNNQGIGWQSVASIPEPRNHFSAAAVNGKIYAIGGQFYHDGPPPAQDVDYLQMYDPTLDTWVRKADLPSPRSHSEPGTFVHDGQIYVAGGKSVTSDGIDDILKYDPLSDTWSIAGRLPQPLFAPAAKIVGDLLIVANGGAPTIDSTIQTVYTAQIESVGTYLANLKIDAGDNPDLSSTFASGSFVVSNQSTNQQRISEITIDLSSAMLPDLVFDTDGTAGDTGFKVFTVDSGSVETGFLGFQYLQPHDHGNGQTNGFDILKIDFEGFDPGETFTFSIDIDPTSIKGASDGGPADAGKISGLELIGSTVELKFADDQIISNKVYQLPGSEIAGYCDFSVMLPNAPSISIGGETSDHPLIYEDQQIISLTGTPGQKFRLFAGEAGWFVEGLDVMYGGTAGGFDPDPFETNKLINSQIHTANFGNNGGANVAITLVKSDPEAGFHHIVAVEGKRRWN